MTEFYYSISEIARAVSYSAWLSSLCLPVCMFAKASIRFHLQNALPFKSRPITSRLSMIFHVRNELQLAQILLCSFLIQCRNYENMNINDYFFTVGIFKNLVYESEMDIKRCA